jgi:hypothetical protein
MTPGVAPFTLKKYGSLNTSKEELGRIGKELEEAEKCLADVLNNQRSSSFDNIDRSDSPVMVGSPITNDHDLVDKIQQSLVVEEMAKLELSTILDNFRTEEKNLVSRAGVLSWKSQEEFSKADL